MVTVGNVPTETDGDDDCAKQVMQLPTNQAATRVGLRAGAGALRAAIQGCFFMVYPLNQEKPNIPRAEYAAGAYVKYRIQRGKGGPRASVSATASAGRAASKQAAWRRLASTGSASNGTLGRDAD